MNKKVYYLLNLTWGLPMTLIGGIVAVVLFAIGKKPRKRNGCLYFEIGERWGGVNLGLVILTAKDPSESVINHELGHSIQNAFLGVLMPFIVGIPSALRYWYRKIRSRMGLKNKSYDAIWFERQATELGNSYAGRF